MPSFENPGSSPTGFGRSPGKGAQQIASCDGGAVVVSHTEMRLPQDTVPAASTPARPSLSRPTEQSSGPMHAPCIKKKCTSVKEGQRTLLGLSGHPLNIALAAKRCKRCGRSLPLVLGRVNLVAHSAIPCSRQRVSCALTGIGYAH